jgi:hypothetical protein
MRFGIACFDCALGEIWDCELLNYLQNSKCGTSKTVCFFKNFLVALGS